VPSNEDRRPLMELTSSRLLRCPSVALLERARPRLLLVRRDFSPGARNDPPSLDNRRKRAPRRRPPRATPPIPAWRGQLIPMAPSSFWARATHVMAGSRPNLLPLGGG